MDTFNPTHLKWKETLLKTLPTLVDQAKIPEYTRTTTELIKEHPTEVQTTDSVLLAVQASNPKQKGLAKKWSTSTIRNLMTNYKEVIMKPNKNKTIDELWWFICFATKILYFIFPYFRGFGVLGFWGFVLSVRALYSLLGLCIVISCIPIQFSPPPGPRRAAPGPSAGGPRPLGGRPRAHK